MDPLWIKQPVRVAIGALCISAAAFAQQPNATPTQPTSTPPPPPQQVDTDKPNDPWRLSPALGLPDWLRISGSVRLRYESLDGQFRGNPGFNDNDQYWVARSLLKIEADFLDHFTARVEGIDSRQDGASQGSVINTGIVNTYDFLQANISADLGRLGDGRHDVTVGRFTMDRGSRRLIARNRFRNTINAFDGGIWDWNSDGGSRLSFFYALPVRRKPLSRERSALLDNDHDLDDSDKQSQFYGMYWHTPLDERTTVEAYLYALDDRRFVLREHFTPGFRVKNTPSIGSFDYEVEGAMQFGRSDNLTETPPVVQKEDHLAGFAHASVGYTFDASWTPRVRVAWDYASGDSDPNDGENNRFDTLFGARRFEYGPTGIYGAVFRANLNSPEIRLILKPTSQTTFMTAFRQIWLADERDFWVPAGVIDRSGASGDNVGQQWEARLRYELLPKSVRLEVGGAYLFAGSFQKQAPNGRGTDTIYGYAQVAWTF